MDTNELLKAIKMLESEKNLKREALFEAIRVSLINACKTYFGTAENVTVNIDPKTCEIHVIAAKKVVETIEDDALEMDLEEAREISSDFEIGDTVNVEIDPTQFGRIVTSSSKNMVIQKIREDERNVVFDEFAGREHQIVTGTVQRNIGRNLSINLGRADALLTEKEMIRGEHYNQNDRIKVYILEVKNTPKGLKIRVSRTHPEFIKRLFEEEVTEVRDGIVEIRAIAREAGNRTKIAVWSNDPDVDPVGACVGMNGTRVNAVVSELGNEKIDIINWNENPAMMIENALSPAKVISVIADSDEKTAKVVVPDYQLSLAIGKEGQNARLAARLTGFKIDIKSETQARESGDFLDYDEDYDEDDDWIDHVDWSKPIKLTMEDRRTDRDLYIEMLKDQIQYDDILHTDCFRDRMDIVDGIINIIADIATTKPSNGYERINGRDYPHEVVKSRLLKMDYDTITHVLSRFKENTTKIRNMRSYLLTALYNARDEKDIQFQNVINHDLHGDGWIEKGVITA